MIHLYKKNLWLEARDYLVITLALATYALALNCFMLPYEITTGGVAGIGTIVYYATNGAVEVQVTYLCINFVLMGVALKVLGWKFCVKTIFGVLMLTFLLWLFQRILPIEELKAGTLILGKNDKFLACVIGAILEGTGLAFCFLSNGSTGGTDIIAAVVNKYRNVSLGYMIMACDVVIISSCWFIFGELERVIYGFVMLFISSFTLDYVMNRQRQSVQFMIFSRNYSKIADMISQTRHGVTVLSGEGWFTKTERKVVFCIVRKRESVNIFRMIKMIDPYCFVSIANVRGVYGEGFDKLKAKRLSKKKPVVFVTNNKHKLEEVRNILGDKFDIRSLADIGCNMEIPENGSTFEENALEKAHFVKKFYGFDCFADDSGLEVEALDGAPGVRSARYASEDGHDNDANNAKLLQEMEGKTNHKANFKTVIAYVTDKGDHCFEGKVNGQIITEKRGTQGFGYDPLFVPDGYEQTFAEMGPEEKNKISHRARAVQKFVDFLNS